MLNSNAVIKRRDQIETHEKVSGVVQTIFVPEIDRREWNHLVPYRERERGRQERKMTYSSMAATCSVVIVPLVLKALDTCPLNSSPSFAIFNTTSLTSSPRYIPPTIFSRLRVGEEKGAEGVCSFYGVNHIVLHNMSYYEKNQWCSPHICFPGLLEAASKSLSNSVT